MTFNPAINGWAFVSQTGRLKKMPDKGSKLG